MPRKAAAKNYSDLALVRELATAMLDADLDGTPYPAALMARATESERQRAETLVRAWYSGRSSAPES
jgi:hypothetical protein